MVKFHIEPQKEPPKIPDFTDHKKINVKYPLMAPYAYAHVFWNEKRMELVYYVDEPILDETEKELLRLVQLGLEEMINISYVRAKKMDIVLQYLERSVQSIISELGTRITEETYNKIMYYIFRDSIGLNRIEPILSDYYIEDLECNGIGFPIFVVHRKYENLRTNVIYREGDELIDFIEKLAQKSDRYVSYAQPILDGTLPDGSRVNATYTKDITTRGPTFTIRKFTKDPWSPIHLMMQGTADATVFAYLWLAIENKSNIIIVGETASGKTTFLNSILHFIPPEARIGSIEDTRELNLAHSNWLPSVTRVGFGLPNLVGVRQGEMSLFDLLKETFRQNPDYVVVGEARGQEVYVLFQGMASGHACFSTFHAGSIETLVRRLETPPINLSPSLIESLDIVCILSHVKSSDKNIRRLKELREVLQVSRELGSVTSNLLFDWEPIKDSIRYSFKPTVFDAISKRTGKSREELDQELILRTKLLEKMQKENLQNYKDFNKVISLYYKDPDLVLKKYGIKKSKILSDSKKRSPVIKE